MPEYRNVMELLVEEQFERMRGELGCCTCETCRCDIIALALNHLRPQYVVTKEGELISKLNQLSLQYSADTVSAIVQAAFKVGQSPRHQEKRG